MPVPLTEKGSVFSFQGSGCGAGLQPVFVVALPSCGLVAYTVRHARRTFVEKSTARQSCRVAERSAARPLLAIFPQRTVCLMLSV